MACQTPQKDTGAAVSRGGEYLWSGPGTGGICPPELGASAMAELGIPVQEPMISSVGTLSWVLSGLE